jgi:hypothetical protein
MGEITARNERSLGCQRVLVSARSRALTASILMIANYDLLWLMALNELLLNVVVVR